MKHYDLHDCRACGAKPGDAHEHGCDGEQCRMCGGQQISCDCVYEGFEVTDDIYENGPTQEMYDAFDKRVIEAGGRIPWSGEFMGCADARRLDLWCKWVEGRGWVKCSKDDPEATEDLNRLPFFHWDVATASRLAP